MRDFPINANEILEQLAAEEQGLPPAEHDESDTQTVISESIPRKRVARVDYREPETDVDEYSSGEESIFNFVTDRKSTSPRTRSPSVESFDDLVTLELGGEEPAVAVTWGDVPEEDIVWATPKEEESEILPAAMAAAVFLLLAYLVSA